MRLEAPPGSSVMREKSLLRLVALPRSLGSEISNACTHTHTRQAVEAPHMTEYSKWNHGAGKR